MKEELRAASRWGIGGTFYFWDIRKSSLTKGIGVRPGDRRRVPRPSLHPSSHHTARPTQREASLHLTVEPIKQMSSHSEGFCCKSLINEEKFKEIKVAAAWHMSPLASPCWTFLSSDFTFLSLFPPLYIYGSSLPPSLTPPLFPPGASPHSVPLCPQFSFSRLLGPASLVPPPHSTLRGLFLHSSSLALKGCFHCL